VSRESHSFQPWIIVDITNPRFRHEATCYSTKETYLSCKFSLLGICVKRDGPKPGNPIDFIIPFHRPAGWTQYRTRVSIARHILKIRATSSCRTVSKVHFLSEGVVLERPLTLFGDETDGNPCRWACQSQPSPPLSEDVEHPSGKRDCQERDI